MGRGFTSGGQEVGCAFSEPVCTIHIESLPLVSKDKRSCFSQGEGPVYSCLLIACLPSRSGTLYMFPFPPPRLHVLLPSRSLQPWPKPCIGCDSGSFWMPPGWRGVFPPPPAPVPLWDHHLCQYPWIQVSMLPGHYAVVTWLIGIDEQVGRAC